MTLRVGLADPRSPEAQSLLHASHALMAEMFPAGANHALSIAGLCAPEIRFCLARREGQVMGCGALALGADYGEVKSLFVTPDARGLGVASAILAHLENLARAENLPLLRLETGDTLRAARALYQREGFVERGPFGPYTADSRSRFYEKSLKS